MSLLDMLQSHLAGAPAEQLRRARAPAACPGFPGGPQNWLLKRTQRWSPSSHHCCTTRLARPTE